MLPGRPTVGSSEIEGTARGASGAPRIGLVLDARYRLLSLLGEGGMGLVYEAQHVFLKTRVAVNLGIGEPVI